MATKLRFALFGTGFWSAYQLGGWMQTGEVECVALYNRTKSKALKTAEQFGIAPEHVYDDPSALLDNEQIDFVDICTAVETHLPLTQMAAARGLAVVCQKPMSTTLVSCETLVAACKSAGVPLYINENWRWQYPIRAYKAALDQGHIGKVFRANLDYRTSFPVFDNQPFLKEIEQFILTDIGSHILDVARFLFGEVVSLYCQTHRVHQDIKGEDVATVTLTTQSGAVVICQLSYASPREHDRFPETYIQAEGERGFLELSHDFWVRETVVGEHGTITHASRHKPPRFAWADPEYDVVHSSIYPAQLNIARALKGLEACETAGDDNLKTMRLVYKSYESAHTNQVILTLP